MKPCLPLLSPEHQLRMFINVADKISVGIVIVDDQGVIVFWNQWMQEKSGLDYSDVIEFPLLKVYPELKNSRLAASIESAIKNGLPSLLSQSLNKSPFPLFEKAAEGKQRLQQAIQVTPIATQADKRYCLIQITDVSITVKKERLLREQAESLREYAFIDSLTGIANRRRFDSYLEDEFKRAARNKSPLGVILVDIDFFKQFNDTYGHQEGDFSLQRVANALKATLLRPADMVARYGGEEFVIVLPDTPLEGVLLLADKLRKNVENLAIPHAGSKVAQHVTLSLGISHSLTYEYMTSDTFVAQADQALYKAKSGGRNRVELFS